MSYKILLLSCLIGLSSISNAAEYTVLFDQYGSPYAGASYIQSGLKAYKYLDDECLPSTQGKVGTFWTLARLAKISLEAIPRTYFMIAQHEVFGHGYRTREFHFSDVSYRVGVGSGATYFLPEDFKGLNHLQRAALGAGGMEANTILSQQIREPWFIKRQIDNRDARLYFVTALDQVNYSLQTSDHHWDTSNDIVGYVWDVNNWYGSQTLSANKLRRRQIWNLLDPMLYFSLYAMSEYILLGAESSAMPMISIRGYKYLPTPRLLLSPWGPEFQLQNHIVTPKKQYIQTNIRYGHTSFIQSYGVDILIKPIWKYRNILVGNRLYFWRQPNISSASVSDAHNQYGLANFINIEYRFPAAITEDLAGILDIGYKTSGYIEGHPLKAGTVLRAGFKLAVF